jgi:hypothetical protein
VLADPPDRHRERQRARLAAASRRLPVALGVLISVASLIGATRARATDSGVGLVAITSPIEAGKIAHITVSPAPWGRCVLTVEEGTYVRKPRGLYRKSAVLIWEWRIRIDAPRGRSPVIVNCGMSGTLRTRITILPSR